MGGQKSKPDDLYPDVSLTDLPAYQDSDCGCPIIENPKEDESFCGTDFITYASKCQLECAAKYDKTLKMKWLGPCDHPIEVRKDMIEYILEEKERRAQKEKLKNVPEKESNDSQSTPMK